MQRYPVLKSNMKRKKAVQNMKPPMRKVSCFLVKRFLLEFEVIPASVVNTIYLLLIATTGSILEACSAGIKPASIPTIMQMIMAKAI